MTKYQNQPLSDDGYIETKSTRRLTVDWHGAVIVYASSIAKYGFITGVGAGMLATFGWNYPMSREAWLQSFFIILAAGMVVSGIFAGVAIAIKDALFPYSQPVDTFRSLPTMGAPGNMKAQALMGIVDGSMRFGKLKLEPKQQLALCNAIIRDGETSISQRKLAEWGIVPTKESAQAQQLKADFIFTGLGEDGGNNTVVPTSAFYAWAHGIFPQLSPHPTQ